MERCPHCGKRFDEDDELGRRRRKEAMLPTLRALADQLNNAWSTVQQIETPSTKTLDAIEQLIARITSAAADSAKVLTAEMVGKKEATP